MNAETQPEIHSDFPLSTPDLKPPVVADPQRLFLHEPGWRVSLKVGSERVFCYMMAPGQDFYHRLLDGEIYLHHGDERLCIACAERRGLIAYEAKGLRPLILEEGDPQQLTLVSDEPIPLIDENESDAVD